MNIILFSSKELQENSGSSVTLDDYRAEHIVKVLRAEVGDTLRAGQIDGGRGFARIEGIKKKYPFKVCLTVEIDEADVEEEPIIDMAIALPRPIMLRRILSQATALGVGQFFFINANRVEKSFWDSNLLNRDEYYNHLLAGLEQSVTTRLPHVKFHRRFKLFTEEFLPAILSQYSHIIVADPRGQSTFQTVLLGNDTSEPPCVEEKAKVLLCIGPEGGWVDYELQKFEDLGFSICTIGERILKVDTAIVALHSRVTALLEMRSE